MLLQRVLVGILLLPIGIAAVIAGDFPFYALIAFILSLAAWEYANLFKAGGYKPSAILVVVGVLLIVISRAYNGFENGPFVISLVALTGMGYHLISYERGSEKSGTDYAIALTGIIYIGWLGAYIISLREIQNGVWWLLTVLPLLWIADIAAYFVGSRLGKHKLSGRLSPKKTWEGYLGGILFATAGGLLFGWFIPILNPSFLYLSPLRGAFLGFILASTSLLGDLGESMLKRQFGFKDSGTLLPGHGGVFDRIDSWIWGAPVGYYTILFFMWAGPLLD
jgi:phosphatidate cytidylyltransferase